MKKILSVILALALVLCFAACGSDSKSGGSIAGKYNFSYMEMDDLKYTADDLTEMTGEEIEMYIRLDSDGTGIMYTNGETVDMVYNNGQIWPVDEPDAKVDLEVKGNTLTMESEGMIMVFKK